MDRLATTFRRCFTSVSKPSNATVVRASISASGVAAAAASMVAYSSVVSKLEAAADIPDDARQGTHHIKGSNGQTVKFCNPYPSAGGPPESPFAVGGKILWTRLTGGFPSPDVSNVKIPMVKPDLPAVRSTPTALRATWLGHACYFVEFPSGLRVLFDPVFEGRCGPAGLVGPQRYTPPACSVADLPPVDAIVISHSHYDHLSHGSVKELARRNPDAQFFVGLGLEKWFRSSGITNVTELDWWQDAELVLQQKPITTTPTTSDSTPRTQTQPQPDTDTDTAPSTISARITCLPCQHSSGRTGRDHDTTLWASWAVKSGDKSVWFGGDTGYRRVPQLPHNVDDYGPEYDSLPRCPQFKQIGDLRGPFDLGLIPIGAYAPRWLFSWMHANPYDAVEIFKETRCKRAMGIHWGTWILTSEEVEEPPRLLREALKRSGIPETGVFDVCAVGETREF